jgi:hypothetical protein
MRLLMRFLLITSSDSVGSARAMLSKKLARQAVSRLLYISAPVLFIDSVLLNKQRYLNISLSDSSAKAIS